ncbi:MAG: DUF2975 domain-containing protein [Cyclobacteriaceae bacterium]
MKQTTLISISKWICNILMFAYLLGYAFFAILIFDAWFLDGRTDHVDVTMGFLPGFWDAEIFYKSLDQRLLSSGELYLSEISNAMKFWLLFRASIFTAIIILIGWHVLRVLSSIKSLETFYEENVHLFGRMTILAFIAFLFSCFNFFIDDTTNHTQVYFTIAFWPLVISLFFGVLTVVFRQGNKLMEEQKLFV